jgi:hypothetical protein
MDSVSRFQAREVILVTRCTPHVLIWRCGLSPGTYVCSSSFSAAVRFSAAMNSNRIHKQYVLSMREPANTHLHMYRICFPSAMMEIQNQNEKAFVT